MYKYLCLITLTLLATTASGGYVVTGEYGTTYLSGHITILGYQTSRNEFQDKNSDGGVLDLDIGGIVTHVFNPYISASVYTTVDNLVDYGFVQVQYPMNNTTVGVRAGRVNVISGLFAGLGPFSDEMNFLPQGTEPDRIGSSIYRVDGVQLFWEITPTLDAGFTFEFLYGDPVLNDEKGVFNPAFFAIFEPSSLGIEFNRHSTMFNVNGYYRDLSFVFNYANMDANVQGTYVNMIPLEDITGNPEDTGKYLDVVEESTYDNYPSEYWKFGIAYGWDNLELMITHLQQTNRPDYSDYLPDDRPSKYVTAGQTYMARYGWSIYTTVYGGYSKMDSEFGNDEITGYYKEAPDWIDDTESVFGGVWHRLLDNVTVIGEAHYVEGGMYLNGRYQDPTVSKKNWMLYSLSVNLIF